VEEGAAAMAATPEEPEIAHAMAPTLKTIGEETVHKKDRQRSLEREGFGGGGVGFRV
jgi:hypothetical protein